MYAAIITIGDEILIGQTIDTNSAWLGKNLSELGIELKQIISISDKADEIVRAIDEVFDLVDLIIITGGLGPTNDDLTKKTLVDYFGSKLIVDQEILHKIESYFKSRELKILDVHRHQALLPDNADKLINNHGSASGMWFEKDKKIIISLPGVPTEMKGIMKEYGIEKLRAHFELPIISHRTILTWGRGESFIADKIEDWENECKELDLSVAYLPSLGKVKIRVGGKRNDDKIITLVNSMVDKLYDLIPTYIYGEGDDLLEEKVGALLREKGLTIATAESCTGGYLAHLITSVPGSSDYFKGSVVAYSNEIKEEVLAVSKTDLDEYGAVSESVVKQMAVNIKALMGSNIGIATTGIAGPDGGNEEKPVGTIWIGIASDNGVYTKLLRLGKRRKNNIQVSAIQCLGRLIKEIQD